MIRLAGDRSPACSVQVPVKNQRRVLCVFPTYTPAFGTFQHAYKLMYRREGVHAAAGAAADRRLHAGKLAGPFRRREHQAGDRRRSCLGRRGAGHRHAHPGRADPRYPAPRQGGRQGDGAGRSVGLGIARDVSGLRLSPRRRNGRRDRRDRSARSTRAPRHRRNRSFARPRSGCRSPTSRSPPTTRCRSAAICSARCSSRRAAPICANSAISPAFTAASRA